MKCQSIHTPNTCPKCGEQLLYYDKVKRIIRTKNRKTDYIFIERKKCKNCNSYYRILPKRLLPFKQYESELIYAVIDGIITSNTLGYEDYPCEKTMNIWKTM